EDSDDDLDFVLVALGEEWPDWPVGQAAGEDGILAGPTLALNKTAGDFPGGVHAFLVIDSEREEVDAFPGTAGANDGGQHHGIAVAHRDGAIGQASQAAGLEFELMRTYFGGNMMDHL